MLSPCCSSKAALVLRRVSYEAVRLPNSAILELVPVRHEGNEFRVTIRFCVYQFTSFGRLFAYSLFP